MTAMLDDLRKGSHQFEDGLLNPLLAYLVTAREVAGGDLDRNIILMVIGIRAVEHPDFARLSLQDRLQDVPVFPSLGVNTRSIADTTGIPRETVRRKVADLVRTGWVVRKGANLYFTAKAFSELTAVREARARLALKYYEIIRNQIERP